MRKFTLIIFLLIFLSFNLFAQYFYTPPLLYPYMGGAPEVSSRAAVLIDASTGSLLYSKNPGEQIPPASLAKLMTMRLLMKEIEAGRASYDEIIPITVESWAQSQPPRSSLMFLEPRQIVTLREIMLGLSVSSGNDAAVAAALRLAPTMEDFADLMTAEARRMGMRVTRFVESSGISEYNLTTAEEFAFFCRQYVKQHPDSLKDFHSVINFSYPLARNMPESYRGRLQTYHQQNNNSLLRTFPGVDGLKTGYIDESGYNFALTAERDNTRFILVILGAESVSSREADGERLLTWAFKNFKTARPVIESIERERLWKGRENEAELILSGDIEFTSPVDRANSLYYQVIIPEKLIAPLPRGHEAGYLEISDDRGALNRVPLLTARSYEKGNFFKRLWHSILLLFKR